MSGSRAVLAMVTALGLLSVYTIVIMSTTDLLEAARRPLDDVSGRVRLIAEADERQSLVLNYAIVVDAGSSGSRLFVYTWPQHDGNVDHLIDIAPLIAEGKPVVEKISPGLSSLTGNASSTAAAYMTPLLEIAAHHIPSSHHAATPLFIYATAGMRLLPDEEQRAIMSNLRTELPTKFAFHMIDSHMSIIDGQTEGVYSWIAINYILGRFRHDSPSSVDVDVTSQIVPPAVDRPPTVGVIDMGGASLQIAYELRGDMDPSWKKYVKYINLGCVDHDTQHEYAVYVVTFLEFGANQAMARYKETLTDKARRLSSATPSSPSSHAHNHTTSVLDPCMPKKWSKAYRVDDELTYNRRGTGNYTQCMLDIRPLLDRGADCDDHPCSMREINVTHMVDLDQMQLYGFSEYWYSQYDILALQGDYNATLLTEKASAFCSTEWSTLKRRADRKLYPRSDRARLTTQCFKSAWIAQVLHGGFGLSRHTHHFKTVQSIGGQEVQWTLGALLHQMRYFPLRELDRARLSLERARHEEHLHGGVAVPPMLSVLLICVVVLLALVYVHRQRRGTGGRLRRSDYSYMSVPGAIKEHNVHHVTSDYVY